MVVPPMSGRTVPKRPLFNRANTVGATEMTAALKKVKPAPAAAAAAAACKDCTASKAKVSALEAECAELKADSDRLIDGIQTQTRANWRLKEDLRVMIERAQGYKDELDATQAELDVTERLAGNLEKSLTTEKSLGEQRSLQAQKQMLYVLSTQNETVAALRRATKLVAALQEHVRELEADNERLSAEAEHERAAKEQSRARGAQLTACLEALVSESQQVVANMAQMSFE